MQTEFDNIEVDQVYRRWGKYMDEKRGVDKFTREKQVKLFTSGIVQKIGASRSFTADEKEAARYVASVMEKWGVSLKSGGRTRMEKPTKDALYLRMNRAGKAVEAAEAAGATQYKIRQLRAAHRTATSEYEAFVAEGGQ
jgi:hypothetical protein